VVGDVLHRRAQQQVGVALQVAGGDHLVAHVVRVVEGEVAAAVVEGVTELGEPREGLHLEAIRTEPHAVAVRVQGSHPALARKPQAAALVAELVLEDDRLRRPLVGQVHPVVETVHGPIDRVLRVREGEAGERHLADVGAPVAVRVLEVPDVGRGRDQDAALPSHHAGGQHEVAGENRRRLVPAVVVAVLQQLHAAGGPGVERVARHLDHEEAAALVELHGHRARDGRLAEEGLDAKPRLETHGLQRFRGDERRPSSAATAEGEAEDARQGHTAGGHAR
jgi:hypothetical protein